MAIQGIPPVFQQISVPSNGLDAPPRAQVSPSVTSAYQLSPPYVVDISPTARGNALNAGYGAGGRSDGTNTAVSRGGGTSPATECQTCRNRKYVDRSNDPSVSFQTPTSLTPAAAESAVRSHEQEHVSHEQGKAAEEGRQVVFQAVSIQYGICPECGRAYVAGGTTTTVTKADTSPGATSSASGSIDFNV